MGLPLRADEEKPHNSHLFSDDQSRVAGDGFVDLLNYLTGSSLRPHYLTIRLITRSAMFTGNFSWFTFVGFTVFLIQKDGSHLGVISIIKVV